MDNVKTSGNTASENNKSNEAIKNTSPKVEESNPDLLEFIMSPFVSEKKLKKEKKIDLGGDDYITLKIPNRKKDKKNKKKGKLKDKKMKKKELKKKNKSFYKDKLKKLKRKIKKLLKVIEKK